MKHYMAIDLESWVYPELWEFRKLSSLERKRLDRGYVVDSTKRLLALLNSFEQKLTFFVLSELYDWYPELIEEVRAAGHEIGWHTHIHRLLYSKSILEEELQKAGDFIATFRPKGFQAPQVIFPPDGYAVLRGAGFEYSSSMYYPDSQPAVFDGIKEIPISTFQFIGHCERLSRAQRRSMSLRLLTTEMPFGSSYFLGLLGGRGTSYFLKKYEKKGKSAVMFIHNWQIFPPRDAGFPSFGYLLKHPSYLPYTREVKGAFVHLLSNFEFDCLANFAQGHR